MSGAPHIAKMILRIGAFALLTCMAGCGSAHTNSTKTASSGSAIDNTVGEQVKQHLEALNRGGAGIRSVSCIQRGPVPSMGTDAVAFLCSIHANNGEVAKPELWASLPMDEENKVELLDETAERELAARGEAAGLNDGHSESANKSAEEDIHHAEEEVSGASNTTTAEERRVAPTTTKTGAGAQEPAPSGKGCSSFSAVGYRFTQVRAGGEFTCLTVQRFLSLLMDQSGHHYRTLPNDGVEIGGYACYAETGLADCTSPEGTRLVSAQYSSTSP
jgi:hypothetical protein